MRYKEEDARIFLVVPLELSVDDCLWHMKEKGINCYKFHYSKRTKEKIHLKLSPHYNSMIFKYGLKKKESKHKVNTLKSLILGAETSNFKVHQAGILLYMELQKEARSLDLTDREIKYFFKGLDVPFHSWECLSLITDSRTYDFQIEDFRDYYIFSVAMRALVVRNHIG
jgi:hypothetical protein